MLVSTDFPLVIGPDGDLFYPTVGDRNIKIMRLNAAGRISIFATLPPIAGGVEWINGITTGPEGSIYYTEDNTIRRIAGNGRVTTAATVTALGRGPDIPGNKQHPYLRGLKVDANGAMYVADSGDARVLKITPDGKVRTLVQLESPWAPTDVAVFGDVVYSLEFLHTATDNRTEWMPRIRKITPDGKSTVILTVDQMPGAPTRKSCGSIQLQLFLCRVS